jgi:hypothetical protein
MNQVRQQLLPYCLTKVNDHIGGWILLNREYKPLGWNNKEHAKYEDVPKNARIKKLTITQKKFYSWNKEIKENSNFVYLYYDGNIPTSSKENWQKYSKKLEKLSNLKTFHNL